MPINEFTLIQTKLKKNVHTMRRKNRLTSGSISLIKNCLEFYNLHNKTSFEKLRCYIFKWASPNFSKAQSKPCI
jgi:hypothetical protein